MAQALHEAGHAVEVFTTRTRSENCWRNELPPGTAFLDGIPIQRFAVDVHDRQKHLESLRPFPSCSATWPAECESAYLRHTVRSTQLIEALRERLDQFEAIIVGPYLFGLTHDVAVAFPEKTLLVPCFHDEPLARLQSWITTYERVGGILYHSAEEREFTQAELGLNHPTTVDIGTYLPAAPNPDQEPWNSCAVAESLYLVYCGRYSPQKDVPLLLEYARRYDELRPGRYRFLFLGQGSIPIPQAAWAQDLGFVSEQRKRQVMRGAAALVQLSRNESLSLVALEAWNLGVPVLASRHCAVVAGHVQRSGGGLAVSDFDSFALALDDLWDRPQVWRQMGARGQHYVRATYGSQQQYADRLLQAIAQLQTPWRDRIQQQARQRCEHGTEAWHAELRELVEELLHQEPAPCRQYVEVIPQTAALFPGTDTGEALVPIHVVNAGTHIAAATGPGRFTLCAQAVTLDGQPVTPVKESGLPALLLPGRSAAAVIAVPVPQQAGRYQLRLWAQCCPPAEAADTPIRSLQLTVNPAGAGLPSLRGGIAQRVQSALARVEQYRQLPTDYTDISTGWLGRWKKWLKQKLLNNFKVQYVDVLSRQQASVNEHLLQAVEQLSECCATLDHAVQLLQCQVQELRTSRATAAPLQEQIDSCAGETLPAR
jgi:glycosyltransferase involved in cell wall biosynthesis